MGSQNRPDDSCVCLDESKTWGNESGNLQLVERKGFNDFLWECTGDGRVCLDESEVQGDESKYL